MKNLDIETQDLQDAQHSGVEDLIMATMYALKQQGVLSISTGDLMVLLGQDLDEILETDYQTMLSLPDSSDDVAESCLARITNQIH